MMGVTGAQRASAEAKTTIETRPRSADRSRSVYKMFKEYYFTHSTSKVMMNKRTQNTI